MTEFNIAQPTDKRPLFLFLALVTSFAAAGYAVAMSMGDDNRTGGLFIVQFAPLVAAFITKFVFQRNLRGLGWGWGKTRYQIAAYGLAFLLPLISFGLVWLLGFGGFYNVAFIAEARAGIAESFGQNISSPWGVMLALITVGGIVGMLTAFGGIGEELGWRGFLVPELYKHYDFTKTVLISGVIWAIYHWPLIILLMGPRLGVSPIPLMAFVLIASIGLSTIMAWFRLRSRSVWTAVIFHMALNVHTQGFFQNLTVKTSWLTHYISGEHGLMLAIVSAAAGYWFWSRRAQLSTNDM
ncbi:MAG: CPBP family intramembrane metalloprotease [Marinosulfonomonas sp.]|nr:CPBP family intramembrane metalloprotease [Marinosulfonomonas sp.]